ncbi:sugar transporter [Campylobacter concisus]|uniref:sugar transporter n=1 Tax=Campylobacter concisus TaxID=199 RepID=UPI00122C7193|nr:sugar transporter [Campylobacter concisus]
MPDKTKLKEGDIFYVYNDYYKKFFFGKILADIMNRFVKRANEGLLWPLDFFSDCYLVAVYKDIADTPVLKSREFIIPGSFIYKSSFNRKNKDAIKWVYYDHEDINYKELEFPEYLISSNDKICLERGELSIPTGLTRAQYENEFNITGTKTGGINYSNALLLQGLSAYKKNIDYSDLRLLPELRKKIYEMIGEDQDAPYYELALKHGKDLARFYQDKFTHKNR